jgi:hypothetical protein
MTPGLNLVLQGDPNPQYRIILRLRGGCRQQPGDGRSGKKTKRSQAFGKQKKVQVSSRLQFSLAAAVIADLP